MTKLDQESKALLPRVGWVLYDGGCGFCFRWVHFWEGVIGRRGLISRRRLRQGGSLWLASERNFFRPSAEQAPSVEESTLRVELRCTSTAG